MCKPAICTRCLCKFLVGLDKSIRASVCRKHRHDLQRSLLRSFILHLLVGSWWDEVWNNCYHEFQNFPLLIFQEMKDQIFYLYLKHKINFLGSEMNPSCPLEFFRKFTSIGESERPLYFKIYKTVVWLRQQYDKTSKTLVGILWDEFWNGCYHVFPKFPFWYRNKDGRGFGW